MAYSKLNKPSQSYQKFNSTEDPHLLFRHYEKMRTLRTYYEYLWDDLTEYVLPSQGTYVYRDPRTDPERRSRRRFECTAVNAARNLMARVVAEMTGSTTRWFDCRDEDPELDRVPHVRAFLQQLSDKMYSVLASSTFRTAHIEATMNWIVYGLGCVMVEEDEDNYLCFRAIHNHELWLAENKYHIIDYQFRKFVLQYRQLVQRFGEDVLPDYMLEKGKQDPLWEISILHCVKPNEEFDPERKTNKNFKFKSVYMLSGGGYTGADHTGDDSHIIIGEGYFKRNPYISFRFWKRSGEVYGGSPAVDSLADIRMLNQIEEANIRSIQLEAFPPLIMAHDSVIMPIRLTPNGMNYGGISPDGKKLITSLYDKAGNRESLEHYMEQKRQAIQSAFFVDPRMNESASIRTAAEVNKRAGEELVGLSPFLGRYEVEYLHPLLGFVMEYALKHDKSLVVPRELHNRIPKIEFSAPLAKTQRAQELNNSMQFLQIAASMAQQDPTILQHLDLNKALANIGDLLGVPQNIINSPEKVKMLQDAQAKQAQIQQENQTMAGGAQAAGGAVNSMAQLAKSGLIGRQDLGLPPLTKGGTATPGM